MKHFLKEHRYHFGLWLISAGLLIVSTWWLNNLNYREIASRDLDDTANGLVASAQSSPRLNRPASSPPSATGAEAPDLNEPTKPRPASSLPATSSPPSASATNPALPPAPPADSNHPAENSQPIIAVVFKFKAPDWSKELPLEMPENSTVYDAMVQLQERGLISIVFKQYSGLGAFIQSIGGVENTGRDNKFWIYYINDKAATLGVSSTKLNPNDVITWKYEESKF